MNFNIKCIGKLPGPTNEFKRSLVLETGEFERPKFECFYILNVAALDETIIPSCLHFSMQNIE